MILIIIWHFSTSEFIFKHSRHSYVMFLVIATCLWKKACFWICFKWVSSIIFSKFFPVIFFSGRKQSCNYFSARSKYRKPVPICVPQICLHYKNCQRFIVKLNPSQFLHCGNPTIKSFRTQFLTEMIQSRTNLSNQWSIVWKLSF